MTVGFDQTFHPVDEGQPATVTVKLMDIVTLNRDVVVTVRTVNGTADGSDGMM